MVVKLKQTLMTLIVIVEPRAPCQRYLTTVAVSDLQRSVWEGVQDQSVCGWLCVLTVCVCKGGIGVCEEVVLRPFRWCPF